MKHHSQTWDSEELMSPSYTERSCCCLLLLSGGERMVPTQLIKASKPIALVCTWTFQTFGCIRRCFWLQSSTAEQKSLGNRRVSVLVWEGREWKPQSFQTYFNVQCCHLVLSAGKKRHFLCARSHLDCSWNYT